MLNTEVSNRKTIVFALLIFSLLLKTNSAFAQSGNWVVGLSGGDTFPRMQKSNTTVPNGSGVTPPYNLDTYTVDNPSTTATAGVFGGYQWQGLKSFLPYSSVLLRYEHQFNSTITGKVQEFGLPLFTNYNYSMKLQSDVVNVVGKLDFTPYKSFLPYVSVGLGIAFNRVSNYNEDAIPPVSPARVSPNYNSKTNVNFAYSLGAGIDYIYSKKLWLTLGYQFADLGKVNSGPGMQTWSNTRLSFGAQRDHTILGSITYQL